jgi:hypothetical protein
MVSVKEKWTGIAEDHLKGRTIVSVEYMSNLEAEEHMWYKLPIILTLDDDSRVIVSMDDEGNDGGALFVVKQNPRSEWVIPTLQKGD